MVIKDDNRFASFYEFEAQMLKVGEALGAAEIIAHDDIPCPRCGNEWHAGMSFAEDTVDVFVDSDGLEINADDPAKALNTWLIMTGQAPLGTLIPTCTHDMRTHRWASGT